jgi:iron complex outermembrane receptor protein
VELFLINIRTAHSRVNVNAQGSNKWSFDDFDGKVLNCQMLAKAKIVFFLHWLQNTVINYTKKSVTVSLKKMQPIHEVVIQVGYGTVKKKDATGAVTVLTSKDFNRPESLQIK